MKASFFPLVLLALIIHSAVAQDQAPVFSFEETSHDFGKIEEDKGPVSYTFNFTNTGKSPLVIQNVQASCGCTTPAWTRDPVLPGNTGFIKAEYNPRNRPGSFNKTLTVTANTNPTVLRLTIQGSVNPRPHTVADDYPAEMGGIRVRFRSLNFGKITTEKPVTQQFDVYNQTDHVIIFLDKMDVPEFVQVHITPQALPPMATGKIMISYDPAGKNDLGFVSDPVVLYTDEPGTASAKEFRVVATIEEYFPPMTAEDLSMAPKLTFDKSSFDFGSIKNNEKVTAEFSLTNTGKSDLEIRMTKVNCACTVADLEKKTIKPGESIPLKITFDPTGRRGVQQKSVSIFSNDPMNPTQMIILKANVESGT
jgi:hypothetical protein